MSLVSGTTLLFDLCRCIYTSPDVVVKSCAKPPECWARPFPSSLRGRVLFPLSLHTTLFSSVMKLSIILVPHHRIIMEIKCPYLACSEPSITVTILRCCMCDYWCVWSHFYHYFVFSVYHPFSSVYYFFSYHYSLFIFFFFWVVYALCFFCLIIILKTFTALLRCKWFYSLMSFDICIHPWSHQIYQHN